MQAGIPAKPDCQILLRYSWWLAWQATDVEVFSDTLVAAKELCLLQGNKTLHADNTFIDLDSVDTDIKFASAVCTCLFIFHDQMCRTTLKIIELICYENNSLEKFYYGHMGDIIFVPV